MKPTPSLRSFLLKKALPTAITVFCLLNPSAHAAKIWDGGGANNSTLTANNWDNNVVPTGGTLTFAGTTRPAVDWDGINSVAPINLAGFTFSSTAAAFTLNSGTQPAVQFTSNGTGTLLNSSSNLQTLGINSRVFFNGTKTFNAGTAGLALNGGITFRGDQLTTNGQINRLDLIGSGNSTTSFINRVAAGGFTNGATTSLVKDGTGKWTVTGNVSDTGPTTITQGTLEYQGSISSSTITNNAAMILNNATAFSYANGITGSGTLTKNGAGTFTLSGTNSHAGATNVNDGTLLINGSISTSVVTVASAATLGGNSGTFGGATTVNGTLAPGAGAIGTLNFSSSLSLGGTYAFELTGGDITADLGNVSGALDLTGATLDLVQLGTYMVGDKFTLFGYSGSLTGTFSGLTEGTEFTDAGGLWKIAYADSAGSNGGSGSSFVTITAVPEPSAALLGGLGLLALLRRRR